MVFITIQNATAGTVTLATNLTSPSQFNKTNYPSSPYNINVGNFYLMTITCLTFNNGNVYNLVKVENYQ